LTEQDPDILNIGDTKYYLTSFPLNQLKLQPTDSTDIYHFDTGCWRGYLATWNVRNDSPFLISMTDCERQNIKLRDFFNSREPQIDLENNELFAHWYSADLIRYQNPFLGKEESKYYLCSVEWQNQGLEDEKGVNIYERNSNF